MEPLCYLDQRTFGWLQIAIELGQCNTIALQTEKFINSRGDEFPDAEAKKAAHIRIIDDRLFFAEFVDYVVEPFKEFAYFSCGHYDKRNFGSFHVWFKEYLANPNYSFFSKDVLIDAGKGMTLRFGAGTRVCDIHAQLGKDDSFKIGYVSQDNSCINLKVSPK